MAIRRAFGTDEEAPGAYLAVIISQLLRSNNPVKIRLHKFLDDWDRKNVKSRFDHEAGVAYNKSL